MNKVAWIVFILILILPSSAAFPETPETAGKIKITAAVPRDFPPRYEVDASGRSFGFAIEAMDAIAELGNIEVRYLALPDWAAVEDAIVTGRADIIPNFGISEERKEWASFTSPIETSAIGITVRRDTYSVSDIEDLRGKKVGVVEANVAGTELKKMNIEFTVYKDTRTALYDLLAGHSDAIVHPMEVVDSMARRDGVDVNIKHVGKPLLEIKRAIAVRKNYGGLLQRLDKAASEFVGSEEHIILYSKWFGAPPAKGYPGWILTAAFLVLASVAAGFVLWRRNHIRKTALELAVARGKEAELKKSLDLSEHRFALAFIGSNIGLCDYNIKTGEFQSDKRLRFMLGYDEIGSDVRNFERLIHPEDKDKRRKMLETHLEGKSPHYEFEFRMLKKDGQWAWLYESGRVVEWAWDGMPSRIITIYKDISKLKETEQMLISQSLGIIKSFSHAIDAKSRWTEGHSTRVALFCVAIGEHLGLLKEELENLNTGALLHDIGKIGTYDHILDKPGKLTDEEFEIVKKHPGQGALILNPIKGFDEIIPIVRHHHERFDGKGYPDGLKGDQIPIAAKIACVADSFDSMTADRPYRPAPGRQYGIAELRRCGGAQFDPDVAGAFVNILERGRFSDIV